MFFLFLSFLFVIFLSFLFIRFLFNKSSVFNRISKRCEGNNGDNGLPCGIEVRLFLIWWEYSSATITFSSSFICFLLLHIHHTYRCVVVSWYVSIEMLSRVKQGTNKQFIKSNFSSCRENDHFAQICTN